MIASPRFQVNVNAAFAPLPDAPQAEANAWVEYVGDRTVEGYKYNGTIYRDPEEVGSTDPLLADIRRITAGWVVVSGDVTYRGSRIGSFADVATGATARIAWQGMVDADTDPDDYTITNLRITSTRNPNQESRLQRSLEGVAREDAAAEQARTSAAPAAADVNSAPQRTMEAAEQERTAAPQQAANSAAPQSPQSSGAVYGVSQSLADQYRRQWERQRASEAELLQAQQEFVAAAAPLVAAIATELVGGWERRKAARAREKAEQRDEARRDLLDQYYEEVAYRLGDIYGYYQDAMMILTHTEAWREFNAALERGRMPPLDLLKSPRNRIHSPTDVLLWRRLGRAGGDSVFVFTLGLASSEPLGEGAEMMGAQMEGVAETIRGAPLEADRSYMAGGSHWEAARGWIAARHPFPAVTIRWGPVVALPVDALARFATTLPVDAESEARAHTPLDRAILDWLRPETAPLTREDYLVVAANSRTEAEDLLNRLTRAPTCNDGPKFMETPEGARTLGGRYRW